MRRILSLVGLGANSYSNAEVPVYNEAAQKFLPGPGGSGGASALGDLDDVNLTGLADKDLLTYAAGADEIVRTDVPSVARLVVRGAGSGATHALDFESQSLGFNTAADELLLVFAGATRFRWSPITFQINSAGGRVIFGAFDGDVMIWEEDANGLKIAGGSTGKGANLNVPGIGADHGEGCTIKSLSEETTIAAAAFTDTAIQIPAGALVLGVGVRVTTVIPTATGFDIGVPSATTRYGTGVAVAANTTNASPGTTNPSLYAAATAIRITPGAQPGAATGKVRVTVHFLSITAPTS